MNGRARRIHLRTGDDWLPALPAGWSVVPSKALFSDRRQHSSVEDQHLTPSQKHGVVTQRDYMEITGTRVVQNLTGADNMKRVRPGDFVIHLRSFQGGIEHSDIAGKVSLAYTVLTPRPQVWRPYYRFLLKSERYVQALRVTVNQLRDGQSIRYQDFARIHLPLPPLAEQQAIADFLDRETAKIDTLIEKQNALIERLRERRESVVVRGVFGANSRTRDLPTLIGEHLALEPLLAMTPAHWQVLRFKACLRRSEARNDDLAQPMMSLKINGQVAPRAALQQEPDAASLPRYLVVNPDELVVNPMWLVGGAVGVSEVSGAVSPDYRVFRVRGKHFPRYLHYLLRTRPCIDQYTLYTRAQTTFDRRVQQPQLDNLPLPVPPLDEQREITEHLDHETAKIDALLAKAERFVEVASERRAALITAGVTGQIDVTKEGAA